MGIAGFVFLSRDDFNTMLMMIENLTKSVQHPREGHAEDTSLMTCLLVGAPAYTLYCNLSHLILKKPMFKPRHVGIEDNTAEH